MDKLGTKAALTEISAIKVVAPTVLQEVVDMAIQLHGVGRVWARYAVTDVL